MKTEQELIAEAVAAAKSATISGLEFLSRVHNDKNYKFQNTKWFKVMEAMDGVAELAHKPPTPPPPAAHGTIGVFAENVQQLDPFVGLVEWAAVRSNQFHYDPIRARGMKAFMWDEPPVNGPDAFSQLDLYMAVVEGPNQEFQARQWIGSHVPTGWCVNDTVKSWPNAGIICYPEAYTSVDPNATADQVVRNFKGRGAVHICPIILLGEGGGRLANYLPAIDLAMKEGAFGFGIFQAGSANADDITMLKKLRN